MTLSKTLVVLAILFCSIGLHAQSNTSRADKLFDKFNYAEALDEYFRLRQRDSLNVHINRQIGICFRKLGLIEQSTPWFEQVIGQNEAALSDKLHYAEGLKAAGDYERAVFWYRRYAKEMPGDRRAELHLADPGYYNQLLADSLRYELMHLDINTDNPSFGMGRFNGRFIFSSAGVKDYSGNSDSRSELAYLDIYVCDLDRYGEAINVEPLTGAVNSNYHDGPACFDEAAQTMYITRNNMKGGRPVYDKSGTANLKIYSFSLENGKWFDAPELPFNSPEYSAGHPAVDPDGEYMIFVSNMPGGYGGTDLYISYRHSDGWSEPTNLGPEINTEGNEMFPFIGDQGNLYFSSDGHAGLGGMDLFITLANETTGRMGFTKPRNLGAPINSRADDFSIYYDDNEEIGYFSSNRGGLGKDNLFRFNRKHFSYQVFAATLTAKEQVTFSAKQIRLRSHTTGKDSLLRLDETGSFRAMVKAGERYEIFLGDQAANPEAPVMSFEIDEKLTETYRFGGVVMVEKVDLVAAEFLQERSLAMPMFDLTAQTGSSIRDRLTDLRDEAKLLSDSEFDALSGSNLLDDSELMQLLAALSEEAADLNRQLLEERLNNLHFGFDSYTIRSSERSQITALAEILNAAPGVEVAIKAHTDSRGDENYNLLLSMRRAKSIQTALTERGVDEDRIRIAWVGSSELLVDCESQPCSAKDHALNRRAEIVVLRADATAEVMKD